MYSRARDSRARGSCHMCVYHDQECLVFHFVHQMFNLFFCFVPTSSIVVKEGGELCTTKRRWRTVRVPPVTPVAHVAHVAQVASVTQVAHLEAPWTLTKIHLHQLVPADMDFKSLDECQFLSLSFLVRIRRTTWI